MILDAPKILVAGSINTDLVVRVRTAPEAGETVTGREFAIFGGGKGANQALAAARSGASVAMLGAVGNDDFGANRLADLESEAVSTQSVSRIAGASSGVALITVEDSGQNRIAYVPGATCQVTEQQAQEAIDAWQPICVLHTLELPRDVLVAIYRSAQLQGVPVICNATPEPELSKDIALAANFLIVNEAEAMALLGVRADPADWIAACHALRRAGPACVVITLGSKGAAVCTADRELLIPAIHIEVVDTTGAGDAFCGAFATGIAQGLDPFEAARRGVVSGALAVTRAGAQPSMPTRDEIEALLLS